MQAFTVLIVKQAAHVERVHTTLDGMRGMSASRRPARTGCIQRRNRNSIFRRSISRSEAGTTETLALSIYLLTDALAQLLETAGRQNLREAPLHADASRAAHKHSIPKPSYPCSVPLRN